jgi:hypothetical protein
MTRLRIVGSVADDDPWGAYYAALRAAELAAETELIHPFAKGAKGWGTRRPYLLANSCLPTGFYRVT